MTLKAQVPFLVIFSVARIARRSGELTQDPIVEPDSYRTQRGPSPTLPRLLILFHDVDGAQQFESYQFVQIVLNEEYPVLAHFYEANSRNR